MDGYLKQFLLLFTNPHCYDEYFVKYNFFDGECLKASISRTLGLVVILGSVTVKVPQILKIVRNSSAEGLNLLGVLLDLYAMTSHVAYAYVREFPFSSWGEVFFLALQTAAIAILILHYTRRHKQTGLFVVGYLALLYVFLTGMIPMEMLWSLQILNLPVVIFGKGLQAFSNFKNKSTGQLSFVTCWMQFAGTTVRIFTSIQETGDATFVMSFVVSSIINGIVALQFLVYESEGGVDKKKKLK